MKSVYISSDRKAYVEEVKPYKGLIELPDGLHPMLPEGVKPNIDTERDSIAVYWQGTGAPEGADNTRTAMEALLLEIEVMRQHHQTIPISKKWIRALAKWGWFFVKTLIMVFGSTLVGLLVYAIIVVMTR